MLFLAVFCGFLAENQREHFVDNRRESKYMKMMLEDLKLDTAELRKALSLSSRIVNDMDTSLLLLYLEKLSDSNIINLYQNVSQCIQIIRIDLREATSAQLKNAGNMRLIRDNKIMDSLAKYWYWSDILQKTHRPNYEADRRMVKDIIFSILSYDNFIDYNRIMGIKDHNRPLLVSDDFGTRVKLGNYIGNMRNQLTGPGYALKGNFFDPKIDCR